ncbi:MAG: hypothetical protein RJA09_2943 [Pseudomonadota bacterium]
MTLTNFRIGTRLAAGFAAVLFLLLALAGLSTWDLKSLVGALDRTVEMEKRAAATNEWAASTRLNINRVMALAKSKNDPDVESYFAPLITQTTQRINEIQKMLEASIESAEGKALLAKIAQLRQVYIDARKVYFDSLKAGDSAAAAAQLNGKLVPAAEAYMASQAELQALESRMVQESTVTAQAEVSRAMAVIGGLTVVAMALGAFVAWSISRSIAKPISQAVDIAKSIAQGDLTRTIHNSRQDEVGELLQALSGMQVSLQKVVGQIRHSSDSIQSASTEVASGNQDLSARTEQAASNLEETASSMEELTATVKQSADAARQANQLASSAAEVAQRGGSVVGQVVTTMDDINQSSQKIADIISVIDGIAFQTNILALNAAVEAARAGEQGRGFAVVAGEVRTLAQRSAQAAKEIKELINTSVEKVQGGSRLVQDAGTTMQEIVSSVQRVSDIIGEITAASSEQSDGIAQVNVAVNHLDQMTQQNAALVEQSAAAAESLKDQAARLTEVIAVFRTGSEGAVVAAPVARARAKAPVAAKAVSGVRVAPAKAAAPLPKPKAATPAKTLSGGAAGGGAATPPRESSVVAAATLKRPALGGTVKKADASSEGDWESF